MIIRMAKVRVLGPRARLSETLAVLQDFGLLQVAEGPVRAGLEPMSQSAFDTRRRRQLARVIEDAQFALDGLGVRQFAGAVPTPVSVSELARLARLARRARSGVARLANDEARLNEERALIQRYRDLLDALSPELHKISRSPHVVTHAVIVPATERAAVEELVSALATQSQHSIVARLHPLRSGELVLLVVMPERAAAHVERVLADARLPEVSLPSQFHAASLSDAVPQMLARLEEIPLELAQLAKDRQALARECTVGLEKACAGAHDALARLEALARCSTTSRAFAIEGWAPKTSAKKLMLLLERQLGSSVAVEELATEEWTGEDVPVVLTNPRLFRPFETFVRMMPLPRYGSIDPTPFVAVFFPLLFGLMLADIGYGIVLAMLGLLLHRHSQPGSIRRTVAEIMGPCAAFTILCGVLFGELFGDFGQRTLGLRPVLFDRAEAATASLLVAIGLGIVHVGLGLVLGVVAKWRQEPKHAVGSAVSALMVAFIILALLAALEVLPHNFLTPSVIALLIAFPILVAVEGAIAPVEFLATLGNILSYARVMALGMASVMLAIVANRMAGAVGSAIVGLLFALLFHLVNFAIGIFGPTVHALRLHYVEFFGKFYSPGGTPYRPLAHWRPTPAASSL
ncbi:MAG TPA: V-type ATPase 116kDa subunit family protein [Gemmatimonadaceae bacterium]|jgi:V/A-type H+-transporting ATPase subunit I